MQCQGGTVVLLWCARSGPGHRRRQGRTAGFHNGGAFDFEEGRPP